MMAMTDVKQVRDVLVRELAYLDSVYFALRAFCDPDFVDIRCQKDQT